VDSIIQNNDNKKFASKTSGSKGGVKDIKKVGNYSKFAKKESIDFFKGGSATENGA
jgi:hypothetical protein